MTFPGLLPFFQWFLALHIICFTAWMAGMFYLPRLYVYHCQTKPGDAESERFKVMERRLLKQIINPAMIAHVHFRFVAGFHAGCGELVRRLVVDEDCGAGVAVRLSWRLLALAEGFSERCQPQV